MQDIIIEEKSSKIVFIGFLGVIMTALSIIIVITGIAQHKAMLFVFGIIAFLFFGLCTIYIYSRCIKSKPLLVITSDGIDDCSTATSAGFISFEEIMGFMIVNIFGQRMIGVQLKDTEAFIEKLPSIKKRAAKTNFGMKLPPVAIRVDTARDMSIEDILTLLQKRLSDYSSLFDS